MKLLRLFILLPFLTFAQSKQYHIVYDFIMVSKGNVSFTTHIKTYLSGDGNTSLYIEDFINTISESGGENVISIPATDNPTFYKSLKTNSVIFNDEVRFKSFNIKDNVPPFAWEISPETKNILGYECQKATLLFRGRNYTVYFTSQIPYSDGPWKFTGLPGMILEVHSDDAIAGYDIVAEKIDLKASGYKDENPYADKEIMTYADFIEIYKKKYDESAARVSGSGQSNPMSKGYREIWITD